MDNIVHGPANYSELLSPFVSPKEANVAISGFYEAVREARQKYGIADVHVLTKINVVTNGDEGSGMSSAHFGSGLEGAPMCAWGLGQEQANYEAVIRQYIKGGITSK